MKHFYLLAAVSIVSLASAQTISIPDVNFKNALCNTLCVDTDSNNIFDSDADLNNDGEIQLAEAQAVIRLRIWSAQISSMEGIQHFSNMQSMDIQENQLESFDFEMPSLLYVNFGSNYMTSINFDAIPNIEQFTANSNLFSSLDLSGTRVTYVDVNNNPNLTYLNVKNGYNSTGGWGFSMTSGELYNLAGLPNLAAICLDEFEIATLTSHYQVLGLTPPSLTTYCSFEPGGQFYTINGQSRFDLDANGCDGLDPAIPFVTLGLPGGSYISGANGNFEIPVVAGTYTVTPQLENPSYFTISPQNAVVSFPQSQSPVTQDFCITANGNVADLEIIILPLAPVIPGFDAEFKLIYRNLGNTVQSGNVAFQFNENLLDFVSATPAPGIVPGGLSWAFSSLNPFEAREVTIVLNANTPTESPALNSGDSLNFVATVTGGDADANPADNALELNVNVVNSFDPNDMTCLEGTVVGPEMIGKYVHYVVRFENTGTFAAQNIVVKDMIDTAKFDIATLIPLDGSHAFETRISSGNKVEFIFENINLPFDDANNDGYVVFKIKTKPTLVLGDTFSNAASIYFDYNFPIVTNTAITTIQELGRDDFEFSKYFTLYPNPANDILKIKADGANVNSISVYNLQGQQLMRIVNPDIENIDVTALSQGNYFIKIASDRGTSGASFIKQ